MFTESHCNRQGQVCEWVGATRLLIECYELGREQDLSDEPPKISSGRLVRELRRGLTAGVSGRIPYQVVDLCGAVQ